MRFVAAAVLVASLAGPAQSQGFPPPLGPERAVNTPGSITEAEGQQQYARVASNGEIALVIWTDTRQSRPMLYGTRLDAGGNVLDPFGVALGEIPFAVTAYQVAWNGTNFVVVNGNTILFITPEMTIAGRKTIDLPSSYRVMASTTGSNVRFLFVEPNRGSGNGAVVDGEGRVVANKSLWTDTVSTTTSALGLAAGNDSGFLLLLDQHDLGGNRVAVLANRIDADGNLISSKPSGAPNDFALDVVAGRSDGFLIVEPSFAGGGTINAYKLDADGIYHGQHYAVVPGNGGAESPLVLRPAVAAENGGWLVAWFLRRVGAATEEWAAELGDDGSVASRRIEQISGDVSDVAVTSARGQRLIVSSINYSAHGDYDLYARTLSSALIPGDVRRITNSSAPHQNGAEIAAGANGFAVIWLEREHLYLRRLSPSGVPQDPAAVDLGPFTATSRRIVSDATGRTYMVGWRNSDGFVIRRLDALSGQWLDPEPVVLPSAALADLASNGTSVLVAGIDACPQEIGQRCLFTARVPFTAQPPEGTMVSARLPASSQGPLAIGSNGLDYLVAFANPPIGQSCCSNASWQVHGLRLRADGTALDPLPLALDSGKNHPNWQFISISSAGGRYLVVWQELDGRKLYATRVTAEGAVLDGAADGSAPEIPIPAGQGFMQGTRAAAIGGQLAIVIGRLDIAQYPPTEITWEGVAFSPDTDVVTAGLLPRTFLVHSAFNFAVATRGPLLGAVYDHPGERDTADVNRVFFRLYGTASPHRRAAH